MAFQKYWLLTDRVCYIQFENQITLDDIRQVSTMHEAFILNRKSEHPIHYIVDNRQVKKYPRDIRSINRQITGRMLGMGWMMLISDDFFIEHLSNILGQLFHFNVRVTGSVHQAYHYLQSIEQLPELGDWSDYINELTQRGQEI